MKKLILTHRAVSVRHFNLDAQVTEALYPALFTLKPKLRASREYYHRTKLIPINSKLISMTMSWRREGPPVFVILVTCLEIYLLIDCRLIKWAHDRRLRYTFRGSFVLAWLWYVKTSQSLGRYVKPLVPAAIHRYYCLHGYSKYLTFSLIKGSRVSIVEAV